VTREPSLKVEELPVKTSRRSRVETSTTLTLELTITTTCAFAIRLNPMARTPFHPGSEKRLGRYGS
jgi:hypothetical protein